MWNFVTSGVIVISSKWTVYSNRLKAIGYPFVDVNSHNRTLTNRNTINVTYSDGPSLNRAQSSTLALSLLLLLRCNCVRFPSVKKEFCTLPHINTTTSIYCVKVYRLHALVRILNVTRWYSFVFCRILHFCNRQAFASFYFYITPLVCMYTSHSFHCHSIS